MPVAFGHVTRDWLASSRVRNPPHHNNGNIVAQTIGASSDDVWQQYYTYDGTNRLAMASEDAAISGSTCPTGATWCQKYGYDHFGNRWIAASLDTLHMATPTAQSAVSLATNRLTSGTYDAAGNLTAQAYITTSGGSMAYDANNKVTSFTATGVSVGTKYDSAGRRVRKIHNGETTIWVYDAFGKLAAEYTTETQTTPVGTYYRTTDHLGSTRLVTDDQGRVRQRHDFFPFGEYIPASASFDNRNDVVDGGFATYNAGLSMRQQFTSQQRDEETGLDYFWARNMAAPLGRFSSMDPENAGAELETPQSWNAYAYVHNNPMGFVDPDGRWRESYGDYFNTEPTCGPAWLTYGDFGEPTGLCDDDPWFIWGRGATEHMGAPPPGNAVADYLGEYNAAFSKLSPFMVAAWHGADGYNILFSGATWNSFISNGTVQVIMGSDGPVYVIGGILIRVVVTATAVASSPVVITVVGLSAVAAVGYVAYTKAQEDKRRKAKPTDAPTGTLPLDQAYGDEGVRAREKRHRIKKQIKAKPDDWVGVTPNGDIITTNPKTGELINHGQDFLNRGVPRDGRIKF